MATILSYEYNRQSNKTWARIATSEFTEWLYIDGFVARHDFVRLAQPMIDDMMADFAGPLGQVDIPL